MTKAILLERAKELGIKGRHHMTQQDLETAVRQREIIGSVQDAAQEDAQAEAKPTRNLVKRTNLNVPWRRKYYYLDLDRYNEQSEAVKQAPGQVIGILRSMAERGITNP